ncbi:MAG: Proton antipo protein [Chloroflexi bacterium]|nr:Proton antipo protein [Chloroflexota bacterium]
MSVLLLAAIAIPGGLLAMLTAARPRVSLILGGGSGLLSLVVAASIRASDTVPVAGIVVAGSDGLRTIALSWAAGILLLAVAEVLVGHTGRILGPSLVAFGASVVAVAVADAGLGFALLTAGGVAAAVGPLVVPASGREQTALGLRALRAMAVAGLTALLAVAWGASPAGPFAAADPLGAVDPALEMGLGLGFLAVVAAVVIRLGAIPAHAWAARFADSAPTAAVPATLGWGAAAFALVALSWVDITIAPTTAPLEGERTVVALVAAASVILGGLAAILRDDIEHVLGYSIVQDAGIALLAFSAFRPESASAGRDWLVGMVAVKSGLAAWVLVTRSTFGVRRVSELRGWARRSPILGAGFVMVLIGAIGVPGMATFTARGVLTELGLGSPFDLIVLLAAFAPVAYLGRILVIGVDQVSEPVRLAQGLDVRVRGFSPGGWTGSAAVAAVRALPEATRANRLVLAAASALLVAAIGLSVAATGLVASSDPRAGAGSDREAALVASLR